jgi:hypothetical protein
MTDREITVGDKVRLISLPPYLKTADPMPMLRPPDILEVGVEGIALARRPGNYWEIRFSKGAFLMETQYLEIVLDSETSVDSEANLS